MNHLVAEEVHVRPMLHDREEQPMVIAACRYPGQRFHQRVHRLRIQILLFVLSDAAPLAKQIHHRLFRRQRPDIRRLLRRNIVTFHRSDGTHRQTVLAIDAEPFILWPNMRETVLPDGQNLYDAVLYTSLAFQALRFIDMDHSCIPLFMLLYHIGKITISTNHT